MELQVMILDDEYIILDGLCSFPWSDYGYRISATARNGLEGLEKLEQAKPYLILTDVKMPGMDGLDFAEKAHEIYQIGFVLAAAGSAVGVGNLWRFPYLAAKDGGCRETRM